MSRHFAFADPRALGAFGLATGLLLMVSPGCRPTGADLSATSDGSSSGPGQKTSSVSDLSEDDPSQTQATPGDEQSETGMSASDTAETTESDGSAMDEDPEDSDAGETSSTDGEDSSDTTEDESGSESGGDDGELPDIDGEYCTSIPELPRPFSMLKAMPSSEAIIFDDQGHVVTTGGDFIRLIDYEGEIQAEFSYRENRNPQGIAILPGGDLIITNANARQIDRIDAEGNISVFATGITPNGMLLDMHGNVYYSSPAGSLGRIDAATGAIDVLFEDESRRFDGITLSRDYGLVYYGENIGILHQMAIDADGSIGSDEITTQFDPRKIHLDGMTVDVCANIYWIDAVGSLWRIRADGTQDVVADLRGSDIKFGSGIGGWQRDRLYVSDLSRKGIYEVELGVRGRPVVHLDG